MFSSSFVSMMGAFCAAVIGGNGMSDSNSRGEGTWFHSDKFVVRTTAYTHTEADHLQYGSKSALGTKLRYGSTRSAAADWAHFPVGTKFRIAGDSAVYEVDDYGSALVGTGTIDLYKPSRSQMNRWGVRHVDIEIIEWGSVSKSIHILEPRAYKAAHVREMLAALKAGSGRNPAALAQLPEVEPVPLDS
jgi:3D (Asp-Asp-Asp) domain-containing protein